MPAVAKTQEPAQQTTLALIQGLAGEQASVVAAKRRRRRQPVTDLVAQLSMLERAAMERARRQRRAELEAMAGQRARQAMGDPRHDSDLPACMRWDWRGYLRACAGVKARRRKWLPPLPTVAPRQVERDQDRYLRAGRPLTGALREYADRLFPRRES